MEIAIIISIAEEFRGKGLVKSINDALDDIKKANIQGNPIDPYGAVWYQGKIIGAYHMAIDPPIKI